MDRKPIYQAVISLEPVIIREFLSVKSAQKVGCLALIKKLFTKVYRTHSGREHDLYNYYFLDLKSQEEKFKPFSFGNWSIEDIYEGRYGNVVSHENYNEFIDWSVGNDYIISDQDGEVRKIPFDSPEKALIYLLILSKYRCWADYDI